MAEVIGTAAVIGAGVMGSAIAAQLAGAGIRTYLLDQVPPGLSAAENIMMGIYPSSAGRVRWCVDFGACWTA